MVNTKKSLVDYIAEGSKFQTPLIDMSLKNPQGATTQTLHLMYVFPGDDSVARYARCQKFNGLDTTYCANVSNNNPSEVCVCEEGQCGEKADEPEIYLGCVPRPSPKDSNIDLIPSYEPYIDEKGNIFPSMNLKFHDKINNKDLKFSIKQLKEYYGGVQKIPCHQNDDNPNPPDPNCTEDLWTYKHDEQTVYGITFTSIIPEFTSSSKIEEIYVRSPKSLEASGGDPKACNIYAETNNPDLGEPNVLPANNQAKPEPPEKERERGMCTQVGKDGHAMIPPHPSGTCIVDSQHVEPSPDAELAICPGIYKGVIRDTQRKIYLQLNDNWDGFLPSDPVCAPISSSTCRKIDPKNVTKETGYAVWPKQQNAGQSQQQGECHSDIGFEETIQISSPMTNICDSKKSDYDTCMKTAGKLLNFQTELEQQNLNVNFATDTFNTILKKYFNITTTSAAPERTCKKGNTLYGEIKNPCKFIENCGGNIKPTAATGNVLWTAFSGNNGDKLTFENIDQGLKIYINGKYIGPGIQSNSSASTGFQYVDVQTPGICPAGTSQKSDNPPIRYCRVFYDTEDNQNKIVYAGWTDTVQNNQCS